MSYNGFMIRPALPADGGALKALMLAYIVDFYGSPRPDDGKLDVLIAELQNGRISRKWVAADEAGRLVGFVTLYYTYSTFRAQKVAIMNDLYVAVPFRGTEVAASLFAAIREFAKQDGCAYLGWETAADNARAQYFYEKMGGERGSWVTYSIDL
jgi:GNAT superfamily N-acetyltransferase